MAKKAKCTVHLKGGEKEFLELFHTLTGCHSAWQVWEDLIIITSKHSEEGHNVI